MVTFKNLEPTDIEKELFHYAGLYKTEDDENHSRYVLIHTETDVDFPNEISIRPGSVDHGMSIAFFHDSQTVEGIGTFDGKLLNLITDRMEELGWDTE